MAGLTDATLNEIGDDIALKFPYASLHTAATTTGSNESTAGRVAVTFAVDADGDLTATNLAFTGGTPGGPVAEVGLWSAASGGTFKGSLTLSGDTSFNASGEYTVTSVSIPVSFS